MRGKLAKLMGRASGNVREITGDPSHPSMKELRTQWRKLTPKQRRKWRHRMQVVDHQQRVDAEKLRIAKVKDAQRLEAIQRTEAARRRRLAALLDMGDLALAEAFQVEDDEALRAEIEHEIEHRRRKRQAEADAAAARERELAERREHGAPDESLLDVLRKSGGDA